MTISLKPEHERFIQSQIETGRYSSPDDVLSEAFDLLSERERRIDELRQEVAIGTEQIAKGQVVDGEAVFDRLQQKIDSMSKSKT